jgi:DNA-binding protein HU-beta
MINQGEIIREVAKKENVQIKDVERLVKSLFNSIIEHNQKGEAVHLIDLGTFEVKDRDKYIGMNPRTKENMVIPALSYPKFSPSKRYKNAIKKSNKE